MSVLAELIERMTGLIVDGYVAVGNRAEHEIAREMVREFLLANYNKLAHWALANPGKKPPIYFDCELRKCVWLTRNQERKLQRKTQKYLQKHV